MSLTNRAQEMESLEVSLTDKAQEIEERTGTEDKIKEIDTSVKENVKSKIIQAQPGNSGH